ncbi:hypothetical protein TNCV_3744271 [Trichonephila clavipes]|nr:hypothetical protein TNCV_3744271 [Trichonephila clavipes]
MSSSFPFRIRFIDISTPNAFGSLQEPKRSSRSPPQQIGEAHKTFGPTDLTSTYSVCTRRVFGGIGHRTQAFRSAVRCSNH